MTKNVGSLERVMRSVGAVAMMVGGLLAPLHIGVRAGLGIGAVYLALTALAGTCLGYKMMGLSTCPTDQR